MNGVSDQQELQPFRPKLSTSNNYHPLTRYSCVAQRKFQSRHLASEWFTAKDSIDNHNINPGHMFTLVSTLFYWRYGLVWSQNIEQMLFWSWPTVHDAGPTSEHHWFSLFAGIIWCGPTVSFHRQSSGLIRYLLISNPSKTTSIVPMLDQCWSSIGTMSPVFSTVSHTPGSTGPV